MYNKKRGVRFILSNGFQEGILNVRTNVLVLKINLNVVPSVRSDQEMHCKRLSQRAQKKRQ